MSSTEKGATKLSTSTAGTTPLSANDLVVGPLSDDQIDHAYTGVETLPLSVASFAT
ncbi:hypothetical protein [Rosenbergiella nectarea]|uniref:hypothetical protein n=1 Tax=Rosenbergiella nectarea TaxID=988801 RepID=UPI001BDAA237|nr:hypothetical protein [Rosenbergiella nectarea]MBT0731084.1 hypothetical protein [Rosenbergiella nectarea subsp. apis]